MKWSEEYRIGINEADVNGVASASAILNYIQTTADLQFFHAGPTAEELRSQGRAFFLSRISMSIYKPLYAHDVIRVETWPCESRGVVFNRCATVFRGDEVVAEAVSCWALVDIETHKVQRVDSLTFNVEYHEMLTLDVPLRIRIPDHDELKLVGERAVLYSDVDMNGHMNNTRYPDFFCDYIKDIADKRVIKMTVSFQKEAPMGDMLKVYSYEDDGTYYFRTLKGDGTVGCEAEIVIDEI